MKRTVVLWVIIVVAVPASTALAAPGTPHAPAAPASPRAHLAAFVCHTATRQADRSISVRAVMRPVSGTIKMQMRFELLAKQSPAAAFAPQPGTGLGSWISPADPTLGERGADVWIVTHPVSDLPAPAIYRYRVSFRWTGTGGRVLTTETRSSADCDQPTSAPDLLVGSSRPR